MSPLARCPECAGFVPSQCSTCPNCGHEPSDSGGRLGRLTKACLMLATGGTVAVTLMACYGGPPHAYELGPQPQPAPNRCQPSQNGDPAFANPPPGEANPDCTNAPGANTIATSNPAPAPAPQPP